jgi:hypothetical protein
MNSDVSSLPLSVRLARDNFWFVFFTFLFVCTSMVIGFTSNQSHLLKYSLYSDTFIEVAISCLLFGIAIYLIHITFVAPTKSLYQKIAGDFKYYVLNVYNIVSVLIVVLSYPLVASSLTIIKTLLPDLVPYYLDELFMKMDSSLHFGVAPWELLQPFLGYPFVTFVINVIYNFWFFMQLIVVMWQIVAFNRPRLRMQFLLSYVLVWMFLGSFMAIALSSAGPCFFGNVTHLPDPFEPLFQYLNHTNSTLAEYDLSLWALETQKYLWEHYLDSTVGMGSGISAMPSMHISIATLLVLLGRHTNHWLYAIFTVHAILIFIGSIHLGWHYAVDGYIAFIATYIVWKVSGYLIRDLPESGPVLVQKGFYTSS